MNERNFIIFVITTLFFNAILARPGQLKQQRYEFQEIHTSSSHDHIARPPENARLEVIPVQHEPILWSQQHPNEVNAFAEMFRQNYNQMVEQQNKMMQMHHHAMANLYMPVVYELYHVPAGYTWNSYFGNQQQYIHDQTKQMSRQLIQDLEQGRVSQQDLMNPNFFVAQAATELNRVHQAHNEFETYDEQVASSFRDDYQQHQFDAFDAQNNQQQQKHQIFAESEHHQEIEHTDQVLVYNDKTKEYEYVSPGKLPHAELAGATVNNAIVHQSYIQRLPPVRFNSEMTNKFKQGFEEIEVHTPLSVETSRLAQQHFNEQVTVSTAKPRVHQTMQTTDDEFYGSTYEQQPIYDLQFVESMSSTTKPSLVNVMSLVRKKTMVNISTTTSEPSTTATSTTTLLPTTESSIMSMLPNKRPFFNYTDLHHKVRAELDRQTKQVSDNENAETHFMGMTSNTDHVKLSYETIVDGKDKKESRGDQPSTADDYISEELVESEPGMGYYSVNTEPELFDSTTTVYKSSTLSSIHTVKPVVAHQNPFYTAPLAPFPTTTNKPSNPYYSAPLAPFPGDNSQLPQVTVQSQLAGLTDMNQEDQIIDHSNDNQFVVAETIQDYNEQGHEEINLENYEFQNLHGHLDMQHSEDVQQRYTDIGGRHYLAQSMQHPVGHMNEKQLPPEQSYRNPDLQFSVAEPDRNNETPAHVVEITATPASVANETQKKNWFQRQLSKLKHAF